MKGINPLNFACPAEDFLVEMDFLLSVAPLDFMLILIWGNILATLFKPANFLWNRPNFPARLFLDVVNVMGFFVQWVGI